jgi:enoyl-CoA hydratase/carnithine racemase
MGSAAAARLVEDGVVEDEVGPLAGRPVLAVLLDDADALVRIARVAPACVVVGVAPPGFDLALTPDVDVLLTDARSPGRPWVTHADGLDAALAEISSAVERSPIAAVTLAQLLRLGRALDVEGALVAESLAYSTLQAGPAFRAWLDARPARDARLDEGPPVLVERTGNTLSIVLNRPAVRNAFSAAMRDGVVEGLRLAAADASITSVEVRGEGPSFCSGGDLDEFGTLHDPATAHIIRTSRSAGWWVHRSRDRVTFRVHGACVGAGMELPAFAGHVVAHRDASFHLPEVGMGLVPGAGGTASIPTRIGRQRTAWLAITGAHIGASTALDWGLVDDVV